MSKLLGRLKQLMYDTYIEIVIGAVAVTTVFSIFSYQQNKKKEGEIPIAFSEIEATTKSFNNKGQEVPALTRFYSVTNDVTMKVFESNNIAIANGGTNEAFAHELEKRVVPELKEHALISEYADEIQQDAQNGLKSIDKITKSAGQLGSIDSELESTWDESHVDSYHTEIYYTTSTDDKGNTTTTMHTRQVYDYTDHTYTYYSNHGSRSAQLLQAYLTQFPDMKIENLVHASTTHEDNQNAITKSMHKLFEKKSPTPADLLKLANTWATGSTLTQDYPTLVKDHKQILNLGNAWINATGTAHSTSYRTYSSYDDGPREYQIVEDLIKTGKDFRENASEITDGIVFSAQNVPKLNQDIKDYIDVVLHGKDGNADKMRREIMQTAREIYQKNFTKGFDVDPFSWGQVVLMALLGAALGAAVGKGADYLFDRKKDAEDVRREQEDDFLKPSRFSNGKSPRF